MAVICITQARLGSSRLPSKVMMKIQGKPLLQYHLERAALAHSIDQHIVATTDKVIDLAIAEFCAEHGYNCFRGDEQDVLKRFYDAATVAGAQPDDIIVRLTGDCPLIAPELIDKAIESHQARSGTDYSHISKDYYPRGFDAEVFSMQTLTEAYLEATREAEREHVTPFIYNHPQRYQLNSVTGSTTAASRLRLCVDEPPDFELISRVIAFFGNDIIHTSGEKICSYVLEHTELIEINQSVVQITSH